MVHGLALGGSRIPTIGRVDPSTGVIRYFTAGLTGAKPNTIALASDGRLYFTDLAAPGAIRSITTSGEIETYRAGLSSGSLPAGIAEAGDGALWFTANANPGRLGRLWTSTSAITELTGGSLGFTANAKPAGLSRGPDGNVAFTEGDVTGKIGRVTVAPLARLQGRVGGLRATIARRLAAHHLLRGVRARHVLRHADARALGRVRRHPLPTGRRPSARARASVPRTRRRGRRLGPVVLR